MSSGRKTRRAVSDNQINAQCAGALKVEGGRVRGKVEVVMVIPKCPPSMADVDARAISMGVKELLSSSSYTENVKLFIDKASDWDMLCRYSDFMRENIDGVVAKGHEKTSIKLFKDNPDLYKWLYSLSESEITSPEDRVAKYLALSADWCAVNFRENPYSDLPRNYFHWRRLNSPDDIEQQSDRGGHFSRKRGLSATPKEVSVPVKKEKYDQEYIEQAMLESMRLDRSAEYVLDKTDELKSWIPQCKQDEFDNYQRALKQLIGQYQDRYEKTRVKNAAQ
ncbi:hypothetical protein [Endozoicomonas atrinae]|uniref:hypothetical protein n=1 Tax=Endozoicomonas atrinae TaxID=1333660 RepID=UPI001112E4DB|nr:hypothetical protein [Endozoicomonas atrinae]